MGIRQFKVGGLSACFGGEGIVLVEPGVGVVAVLKNFGHENPPVLPSKGDNGLTE